MKHAPKLSRFMEGATWFLMVFDVLLMVCLPWITEWLTSQLPGSTLYRQYLIFLYVTGVFAELVLWQCRGIIRNVNLGQPFCKDTVSRLRRLGTVCLVLAAIWLVFVILLEVFKFLMAFLMIMFAFIGLILFVFAELFAQATAYKEENDMTI
ncbi:MAG: DUF2975 domain-containing protein [Clostridia bacterium]|nr:DUF2975 domain-containing protein [Clostridia bacterium]